MFTSTSRAFLHHALLLTFLLLSCSSCAVSKQFEWSCVYSPSADRSAVDSDWALWGHNLRKAVGWDKPGVLCFSDAKLYDRVEQWVLDQYGEGTDSHGDCFTIMPDDQPLACTCAACKQMGNTADNATPAVSAFVKRLAERYPHHRFFMTAYLTTRQAPSKPMPDNVGVFLSAIDLPLREKFRETEQYKDFEALMEEWQKVTHRIYVWDYCRNFDDYFTPFPYLRLYKQRLKYYRDRGVSGIFINGSEDRYATFEDLQSSVLTQMIDNTDVDVDDAVRHYCRTNYAATADIISGYYLSLEDEAVARDRRLLFYGGITDAEKAYLHPERFEEFWTTLDRMSKDVRGQERSRLNTLLVALDFTRLELLRSRRSLDKTAVAEALDVLKDATGNPQLIYYRESDGRLDDYMRYWQTQPMKVEKKHCLHRVVIKSSIVDDDFQPVLLTDGMLGIPSDYHTAWALTSADSLTLTIPAVTGHCDKAKSLQLSFLYAPRWRFGVPEVKVSQAGKTIAIASSSVSDEDGATPRRLLLNIPLRGADMTKEITLTIYRTNGTSFACDEITL